MKTPWEKFTLPGEGPAYARGDTPDFRRTLREIFGTLVDRVLPRPREAADARRVAVGRLPEKAFPGGARVPLLVDRRPEGRPLLRARRQQDRRVLCASDLDSVRDPARSAQVPAYVLLECVRGRSVRHDRRRGPRRLRMRLAARAPRAREIG